MFQCVSSVFLHKTLPDPGKQKRHTAKLWIGTIDEGGRRGKHLLLMLGTGETVLFQLPGVGSSLTPWHLGHTSWLLLWTMEADCLPYSYFPPCRASWASELGRLVLRPPSSRFPLSKSKSCFPSGLQEEGSRQSQPPGNCILRYCDCGYPIALMGCQVALPFHSLTVGAGRMTSPLNSSPVVHFLDFQTQFLYSPGVWTMNP